MTKHSHTSNPPVATISNGSSGGGRCGYTVALGPHECGFKIQEHPPVLRSRVLLLTPLLQAESAPTPRESCVHTSNPSDATISNGSSAVAVIQLPLGM